MRWAWTLGFAMAAAGSWGQAIRIGVVFSGGHETDRCDNGRPVVLIAGALGVPAQVFRDAFSGVTPSRNVPPSGDLQRRNKGVLLAALGRYGITNERLDEVSDRYRYRPEQGETWPVRPAKAFAVVQKGKIVRLEIVDGGEGYSSSPTVSVPGYPALRAKAILSFGKDFARNGSLRAIDLDSAKR